MTIQAFTAAAFATLALGFAQDIYAQMPQTPQTPQMPETVPPMGQQAPAAKTALSRSDQNFLNDAAQAGLLEIQGSQMALQKSSNTAVKNFAQHMVDDHGKVADELQALASKKGYALPTGLSVAQQAKFKMLDVRDASFDKAYVDQIGVSAHEDAVKLFQKASDSSKDPDVKAFAAKTLPTLQGHLQMGRQLKQSTQAAK